MTSPKLAIETPLGRFYKHPVTGERLPSVTTILRHGVGSPHLMGWAAKQAAEYADKNWIDLALMDSVDRIAAIKTAHEEESARASEIGTAVHEAVDTYCQGGQALEVWPKQIAGHMRQFAKFLEARQPLFMRSETTIWNRTVGYAGTFDFLALIGQRLTLTDTKTGKNVWPEVGLQLAALAGGETIVHPDGWEEPLPGPIDQLAVLHLRPRSWALIPVEVDRACWSAFVSACEVFDWVANTAQNVLGPRLREVVA